MDTTGARRRDRWLHVMPGDLVEATVYLDVVVTTGNSPCNRVSVFLAFDEIAVLKTASEMAIVSLCLKFQF